MKIGLIDPALYTRHSISPNLGDQIISRAVRRELRVIFGDSAEIYSIPSHQYPTLQCVKKLQGCDYVFVGGSNLMWFRWWLPASWKIGPLGLAYFRNLVLMGVGWGSYAIRPNTYGYWVCRTILSRKLIHSTRDSYTRDMATGKLGVSHVLNTACPTMWGLTEAHTSSIPKEKGPQCIFSLTDYSRIPQLDGQLIKDLSEAYQGRLLFWPQGSGDAAYCRSLGYSGRFIERSLTAFLEVLSSGERFDYVGTRLHAGVLALEHRVRSLIVSIDNRAQEIATDTDLPAVARDDRKSLLRWLEGNTETTLRLPFEDIARWKLQFSKV